MLELPLSRMEVFDFDQVVMSERVSFLFFL